MVVLDPVAKEEIFKQLSTGPKRFRQIANSTMLRDDVLATNLAEMLAAGIGGIETNERLSVNPETNREAYGLYVQQLGDARREHEEYGRTILGDRERFTARAKLWKRFLDDTERDGVPNRYGFKTFFVTKDRGAAVYSP